MTTANNYAKRILETLQARQERVQWEAFIVEMLQKLELSQEERARATKKYEALGRHVAAKLGIADTDAHVFVQGSMRTQTTVSPRGNQNFDLDIVVKLTGPRVHSVTNPGGDRQGRTEGRLRHPGARWRVGREQERRSDERRRTGVDQRVPDPGGCAVPRPAHGATLRCTVLGRGRWTVGPRAQAHVHGDEARGAAAGGVSAGVLRVPDAGTDRHGGCGD